MLRVMGLTTVMRRFFSFKMRSVSMTRVVELERRRYRFCHSRVIPISAIDASDNEQCDIKALFLDAAGTLLYPAQPVTKTYQRFAQKHGVSVSEKQILSRYREAFANPPRPNYWSSMSLRYVGDGKEFWRHVIQKATGCESEQLVEDLYHYYEKRKAWHVPSDAKPALLRLKRHGIKSIVVSNFDTRLRPLLETLGFGDVFDAVIVSAEVEMEKPNPCIFEKALEVAQCDRSEVIHVGDDRRNDIWGAREAGIDAWLWGTDVISFHELAERILSPSSLTM